MNTIVTHATPAPGHRAMTLVEMLVVIALVAVLVAVLLPVLSRGREAGRRVVCLGLLQQYGRAHFSYAIENRGWFVRLGAAESTSMPYWYVNFCTTERRNLMAPFFGAAQIPKPTTPTGTHVMSKDGFYVCPSWAFASSLGMTWPPYDTYWGWGTGYIWMMSAGPNLTNAATPYWTSPKRMEERNFLPLMSDAVMSYPTNISGWSAPTLYNHGRTDFGWGAPGTTPAAAGCEGTNILYTDDSAKWVAIANLTGYNMDSYWVTVGAPFRGWW